jgi:hypothetical protein
MNVETKCSKRQGAKKKQHGRGCVAKSGGAVNETLRAKKSRQGASELPLAAIPGGPSSERG